MRSLQVFLILAAAAPASFAWSSETDLRIASKAAQLAPPDLRLLIEKHDRDYRDGIARGAEDERVRPHVWDTARRRGTLRDLIEEEVKGAVLMMRQRQPIPQFVERLGFIAHLIGDANNPLHVGPGDPRLDAVHADYESYVARRLPKFPTVFYGLGGQFGFSAWLDQTFSRTAEFQPILAEEYFGRGERRSSRDFDDRSSAFGIASVSYSRSVTDLVTVYYAIWKEAGGDVSMSAALRDSNLIVQGSRP